MGKLALHVEQTKKTVLKALDISKGIVSLACQSVGISRVTFYNYMKDQKFADQVNEIREATIDYVEHKLLENIGNNDTTAIIFYLKTIGKRRGYIESAEVTVSQNNVHIYIPDNGRDNLEQFEEANIITDEEMAEIDKELESGRIEE